MTKKNLQLILQLLSKINLGTIMDVDIDNIYEEAKSLRDEVALELEQKQKE